MFRKKAERRDTQKTRKGMSPEIKAISKEIAVCWCPKRIVESPQGSGREKSTKGGGEKNKGKNRLRTHTGGWRRDLGGGGSKKRGVQGIVGA